MNATDPRTRLAESPEIEGEVGRRLSAQEPFAFFCVGVDRLKDYAEAYGQARKDLALRETADILGQSLLEAGGARAFLARLENGYFAALSSPSDAPHAAQRIVIRFDEFAPFLYNPADRGRGCMLWKNPEGRPERLAFMTLSIGVVTTEQRRLENYGQALGLAAELKIRLQSRPHGALSRFAFYGNALEAKCYSAQGAESAQKYHENPGQNNGRD